MNPYESPKPGSDPNAGRASDAASRVLGIVDAQRGMMWLFVFKLGFDFTASIAAELFDPYLRVAYFIALVAVTVSTAYFAFRLANALYDTGTAIVFMILSAMPCLLGTFVILMLNGAAMDQLRKLGVKVGFMGASAMQLDELQKSSSTAPS